MLNKILPSYDKKLDKTYFYGTTVEKDLSSLKVVFNTLFQPYSQPNLDVEIKDDRVLFVKPRIPNCDYRPATYFFASLHFEPICQRCTGYFVREEFQKILQVSEDTVSRLTIETEYAPMFLLNLGFKVVDEGELTKDAPCKTFQVNDKIIYFVNGHVHHAGVINLFDEENNPLISHKLGVTAPQMQSWSELFEETYSNKMAYELMSFCGVKPHHATQLSYKVYRKPT